MRILPFSLRLLISASFVFFGIAASAPCAPAQSRIQVVPRIRGSVKSGSKRPAPRVSAQLATTVNGYVWDQYQYSTNDSVDDLSGLVASDFRLTTSRDLTGFDGIFTDSVPGSDGTFDSFGGTMSWGIYTDNAGQPGTLITSGSATPSGLYSMGEFTPNGRELFEMWFYFPSPLRLPAGTYWLAMHEGAWGSSPDGSPVHLQASLSSFGNVSVTGASALSPNWTAAAHDSTLLMTAMSDWDQTLFKGDNSYECSNVACANDFTVSTPTSFSGYTVVLGDEAPNDNGVLDSFDGTLGWAIYNDNSGAPGTVIASGSAAPTMVDTGYQESGSYDIVRAEVAFPVSIALAPGRYWFVIREGAWGTPYDGSTLWWENTWTPSNSNVLLAGELDDPVSWSEQADDVSMAFWTLAPTAANTSVSGRVVDSNGFGLRSAIVSLTASDGGVRSTRTNSFGYFTFADVATGDNYVVGAMAKGRRFTPQIVNVNNEIDDLVLVAQ